METMDVTPLVNATKRFEEALGEYAADPRRTIVRDGLIQRFEFTYGLCEAMLRRYLELTASGREDIDAMSFPALIRTASERDSCFMDGIAGTTIAKYAIKQAIPTMKWPRSMSFRSCPIFF